MRYFLFDFLFLARNCDRSSEENFVDFWFSFDELGIWHRFISFFLLEKRNWFYKYMFGFGSNRIDWSKLKEKKKGNPRSDGKR